MISFSVTSSVSLPIIKSSHVLLVYITCPCTLHASEPGFCETKEISADDCNFHLPSSFLLFIKSFKYGFIKLIYSSKLNELLPSLLYSK